MASVRQHPRSPFWFGCFTLSDGRRTQRSTKQTDRRKALKIAEEWEDASRKKLSEAQARRVLSDIYEIINDEKLPSQTARAYLDGWVSTRGGVTSPRTAQAYGQIVKEFVTSLGERADRDIAQVTRSDVARYRDKVLKRTSVQTANKALKYLRVALGSAWKDGLIERNPAQQLDSLRLRASDRNERRPFTLPELKTVLKLASPEWRGMILFGFYTGQRLGDIAQLTWQSIDLEKNELQFVTGKTGRRTRLPLAELLRAHLGTLPASDDPQQPLFPQAHALATGKGDRSRLSQQFHGILVAANLATKRSHEETTGDGARRRDARKTNPVSFHSLRHTATSLLKMAGVVEAVARDIIGHESAAVSRNYTHVEDGAKRDAIAKLPDLDAS